MEKNSKIYVAGHRGLVGSAITRRLQALGYRNLILKTHQELDLLDGRATADFFVQEKPEYVFLAAAKVGGILANKTYPADFIYQNLMIEGNVIHQAYLNKVKKLLFLGSSAVYPKISPQPIKEEYLFTGLLDESVKPYAISKIAGLVACQSYNRQYGTNFISAMPSNVYGPNDDFSSENSRVLAALIRRFHEAKINNQKEVVIWGTGNSRREFTYIDDVADACVFLMNNYNNFEIINIGTGNDTAIKELAEMIKNLVGFSGNVVWDTSKPEGPPQKLFDVSKLSKLGWHHQVELEEGLKRTYEWYLENHQ